MHTLAAKNSIQLLCEPCSIYCYYGSASVPKWPQKQSLISKNYLGEHA